MTHSIKISTFLLSLILCSWLSPAYSVAYCALRDPVTKIYTLFPEANSYRSIVHKIDSDVQQNVKKNIPFPLHNDELGQHTLYIAMNGDTPLGIIHSRSEQGLWGLIEIVWAFDFDLNVVDFMFQRCRDPGCQLLSNPRFKRLLEGRSSGELSSLLEQDTIEFPAEIAGDVQTEALAKTVIRSAIKTAVVTDISWHDELKAFRPKK